MEAAKPMREQSTIHNTFVIERSYPKPPERVFAALADAAQKRRWHGEGRSTDLEDFAMDFRVGGSERFHSRFKEGSPFPGVVLTNEGTYQDIVPNRRVVITYRMTLGEKRISASLATFELLPTDSGTDLIFTHQGAFFESADGPKMREEGWRSLLDKLSAELAR
jgi:uncharacterized protein YndB with AHSA1/START domain